MKKILAIIFVSVLVFGCKKEEVNNPVTNEGEISFAVDLLQPDTELKDFIPPICSDEEPDYAKIVFAEFPDDPFYPLLYRIDGVLYTQNIKLAVPQGQNTATYTITEFILYDDNGTPHLMDDDVIVMATPSEGSPWEGYIDIDKQLNREILVTAFEKEEYIFQVLCFQPDVYYAFGFDWFMIEEIIIREECFFGDICIKHLEDYAGSWYDLEQLPAGVQIDMPALMNIIVKDGDVELPFSPFSNAADLWDGEHSWGVGAPLCIKWPDNLTLPDEQFDVEIQIYVKDGNLEEGFGYKTFWLGYLEQVDGGEWYLSDIHGNLVDPGDDGVVELVLGECNLSETDIQLPPYQNLPEYAHITIRNDYNPAYWSIDIHYFNQDPGMQSGFDMVVGNDQIGFCGDANTTIPIFQNKDVEVYSSLYHCTWPTGTPWTPEQATSINWVFNHLEYYGMDIMALDQADCAFLQDVIWNIINPDTGPYGGDDAQDMANTAIGHAGYQPLPGGWAAVLFNKLIEPGVYVMQLIFIIVDP